MTQMRKLTISSHYPHQLDVKGSQVALLLGMRGQAVLTLGLDGGPASLVLHKMGGNSDI